MEERQRERIRKKLLIKVEGQSSVMVDMSANGMKLIVPVLLKKREVDITFEMKDHSLDLTGCIRWIRKEQTIYDQAQYQVGVYFEEPPAEYIELIENLLKK
jgi:hypothetical protein